MLKSFSEKVFQGLTGIKPGRLVLSEAARDDIVYTAKRVRSKDYIFSFDVAGQNSYEKTITTTARWKFICCGVAVAAVRDYPRNVAPPEIGIKFESLASLSTLRNDDPTKLNRVLSELVFPIEGKNPTTYTGAHFEEYKNLFAVLDQRVNITVSVKGGNVLVNRPLFVMVTGIEVFEGGDDE